MAAPWQVLDNTLGEAQVWSQNLDAFLRVQDELPSQISKRLKNIYDLTKSIEKTSSGSITLPELFVDNFDDEQVWQQLELQNSSSFSDLLSRVAKLLAGQTSLTFSLETLSKESCKESNKSKEKEKKAKKGGGYDSDSDIDSDDANDDDDDLGGNDVEEEEGDVDEEKTSDSEGDLSDESDENLLNIKSKLNDTDDKFDKFGSDSDEDLDFDFAAIGEGSEDELEGSEDELEASDNDENRQSDEDENLSGKRELQMTSKSADKTKRSIVDDQFFKLADLENFLDKEDAKWDKRERREKMGLDQEESESEDSEDIDMFQDIPSDDEKDGRNLRYEDFFDPPYTTTAVEKSTKKVRFNDRRAGSGDEQSGEPSEGVSSNLKKGRRDLLGDSGSEGEDVEDILGGGKKRETKSSFEKRQEKLTNRISKMEEELLLEKPWQMAGEVGASHRPENSLLEENLQFEHTTRLPPEITEETTMKLEDIIKQRIKDKVWDDVERKVKPKEDVFEYKKRITLDQEKSKLSLGEIYEQEYLKQQQKEVEDNEDPDHEEIKKMMQSLFIKLDSLSNFHYTPKMPAPEVKIISNLPSITMEEVAPVSVSEAKILAPEEVQEKKQGELKGATEKTVTDKRRERKKKKTEKRIKNKEKEKRQKLVEKLKPGLGNKYSKEKALKKLDKESKSQDGNVTLIKSDKKEKTGLTSSTSFFSQLQEQVTSRIQSQKEDKRKKEQKMQKSSKKLKL
ncbi:hypothetical protein CHS0354_012015 [Potamilus streckersoni]|uniref:U3 small nucleolar ribonucleoprotein protein MPP10 n=1 Tax=Potamilus streckersoni TaxID=2493646 RepID=A0AAE0SB65_9BIVA|nr:hypothetical protein CHS0354_012015 [Potamilus streckersoni]